MLPQQHLEERTRRRPDKDMFQILLLSICILLSTVYVRTEELDASASAAREAVLNAWNRSLLELSAQGVYISSSMGPLYTATRGLEIVATKNLSIGDELLFLPDRSTITLYNNVFRTFPKWHRLAVDVMWPYLGESFDDTALYAMYMAYERRLLLYCEEHRRTEPLCKHINTNALFILFGPHRPCRTSVDFSEESFKLLGATESRKSVDVKRRTEIHWRFLQSLLPREDWQRLESVGVTFEDFRWGSCFYRSRAFYPLHKDTEVELHEQWRGALIPMGEIFNHAAPDRVSVEWLFDEKRYGWVYRMSKERAAGELLENSYGEDRDNAALFPDYGFVIEHNQFDVLRVSWFGREHKELRYRFAHLMFSHGPPMSFRDAMRFYTNITWNEPPSSMGELQLRSLVVAAAMECVADNRFGAKRCALSSTLELRYLASHSIQQSYEHFDEVEFRDAFFNGFNLMAGRCLELRANWPRHINEAHCGSLRAKLDAERCSEKTASSRRCDLFYERWLVCAHLLERVRLAERCVQDARDVIGGKVLPQVGAPGDNSMLKLSERDDEQRQIEICASPITCALHNDGRREPDAWKLYWLGTTHMPVKAQDQPQIVMRGICGAQTTYIGHVFGVRGLYLRSNVTDNVVFDEDKEWITVTVSGDAVVLDDSEADQMIVFDCPQ